MGEEHRIGHSVEGQKSNFKFLNIHFENRPISPKNRN